MAGVPPGQAVAQLLEGLLAAARLVGREAGRGIEWLRERLLALGPAVGRLAASFGVWREQRARRARRTLAREEPDAPAPPEPLPVASLGAAPAPAPAGKRSTAPDIVDHRSDRVDGPEQEGFSFAEATSAGPYQRPDLDHFQRPPEGARTYDRNSLYMNSRILEKKLHDFGVNGRVLTVHPAP